jgi:hypothetical protein
MTSEEQKQILKMVEEGKITANEAMRLMKAIEDSPAQDKIEVIETGINTNPGQNIDQRLTWISDKVKNFWMIPFWIGVGITFLGGMSMFYAIKASGFGFWFYFAWLPFLLGVVITALSTSSRTARWMVICVERERGERQHRFFFGLPLSLAGWVLRISDKRYPTWEKHMWMKYYKQLKRPLHQNLR